MHFEKRNRFYILRRKPSAMVKALTSTALIGVLTLWPLPGSSEIYEWIGGNDGNSATSAENWTCCTPSSSGVPGEADDVFVNSYAKSSGAVLKSGSNATYLTLIIDSLPGLGYHVETLAALAVTSVFQVRDSARLFVEGTVTGWLFNSSVGNGSGPGVLISGTVKGHLDNTGTVRLIDAGKVDAPTILVFHA